MPRNQHGAAFDAGSKTTPTSTPNPNPNLVDETHRRLMSKAKTAGLLSQ
jgi:hypothetical protein